jgi:transposase
MYGKVEKCTQRFVGKPEERSDVADLCVDDDIIKRGLKDALRDGVDWIYLARDKKEWQVVVNTVVNILVP